MCKRIYFANFTLKRVYFTKCFIYLTFDKDCLSQPYPRNTLVRKSSLSQVPLLSTNKQLLFLFDTKNGLLSKKRFEP